MSEYSGPNLALTQRLQRVIIDSTASKWLPVKSGVPQETVLGPLMFLMTLAKIYLVP